ncbi:hypothetical protein ACMD2_19722 [Ananas comosus]|uniref:Uncharacterized protein n=1 Tax=Ananas comosus TaxID=4615 RepID=A0A199UHL3_ANACO|nr:hypothetical protein ACMD2_19722 [Ananas comosus]
MEVVGSVILMNGNYLELFLILTLVHLQFVLVSFTGFGRCNGI